MNRRNNISDVKNGLSRAREFLKNDIWQMENENLGKHTRRLVRHVNIVKKTFKNFATLRVGQDAIALSYFTTMAIVPFIALILFLTQRFGVDREFFILLHDQFGTDNIIVSTLIGWAENITLQLHKGLFGVISFLVFLWLVIWLMIKVENEFNHIWKVPSTRSYTKRFLVYAIVLLLSPTILMFFLYVGAYFTKFIGIIQGSAFAGFLKSYLYWVVMYLMAVLILSLLYKFVPHVKVRYSAALKSAVVIGLPFIVLQYAYLGTQILVTRLSSVYGALAAIPLIMIWMAFNWRLILLGVNMSYAFMYVNDFHPPVDSNRDEGMQTVVEEIIDE
ncbi:MAG: YihY/virulence factor BrkB family protein [Bacteroidales bacterium]|nr:YihY/virulence factor BrkB family protein [Bacteroidales bacterium]